MKLKLRLRNLRAAAAAWGGWMYKICAMTATVITNTSKILEHCKKNFYQSKSIQWIDEWDNIKLGDHEREKWIWKIKCDWLWYFNTSSTFTSLWEINRMTTSTTNTMLTKTWRSKNNKFPSLIAFRISINVNWTDRSIVHHPSSIIHHPSSIEIKTSHTILLESLTSINKSIKSVKHHAITHHTQYYPNNKHQIETNHNQIQEWVQSWEIYSIGQWMTSIHVFVCVVLFVLFVFFFVFCVFCVVCVVCLFVCLFAHRSTAMTFSSSFKSRLIWSNHVILCCLSVLFVLFVLFVCFVCFVCVVCFVCFVCFVCVVCLFCLLSIWFGCFVLFFHRFSSSTLESQSISFKSIRVSPVPKLFTQVLQSPIPQYSKVHSKYTTLQLSKQKFTEITENT